MTDQGGAIRDIDLKSAASAGRPADRGIFGAVIFAARLLLFPVIRFVRSIMSKDGLPRGMTGLKRAVNDCALEFVTEAKRYEKSYKDDNKPITDSRDFF